MAGPAVLILDDGELEDVQGILEELGAPFGRVRGGAIVNGTEPPSDLLITTPRRVASVEPTSHDDKGPIRLVITAEDSNALRSQLRLVGFDYLVRRPVHPEALRLLILRCLYKGDERRQSERVAVGSEVSFRAGLLTRRASLVDLSLGGCRLLSRTAVDEGKRLRVQIPEALDTGEPFTLTGLVVRASLETDPDDQAIYHLGLQFDRSGEDARAALSAVIEDRATGPATLRPSAAGAFEDPASPSPAIPLPELPLAEAPPLPRLEEFEDLEVDMGLEPDLEQETSPTPNREEPPHEEDAVGEESSSDRRRGGRVGYQQTVPAFGKRALRVLVGRDLSMGGMRIEPLPGLELGDRLHLAIYGDPGEAPFLIWATVTRDDGVHGLGLVFDPVEPDIAGRLEGIVGDLPSIEDLRDDEVDAMGTVVSEILER
jgi:hypothetical protein